LQQKYAIAIEELVTNELADMMQLRTIFQNGIFDVGFLRKLHPLYGKGIKEDNGLWAVAQNGSFVII
jgi:hypothetical protein